MSAATPWEAGRFDTRAGPRKVLFGQMYEDVGIERAAFAPGARVFCIASAGDTAMALSLAHAVTAIDINPLQLDYARERIAGAPAVTGAAEGIMGLGRRAMALFGWRRTVVERFLALDDVDVQREYWRAHLDTLGFRLATDALLSVSGLKAVYGSPFLAILPAHFGRVMRGRLARCFAAFPNRANHYARALLLGEPPPPSAPTSVRASRWSAATPQITSSAARRRRSTRSRCRTSSTARPPGTGSGCSPPCGALRRPAPPWCCAVSRSRRMRRLTTRRRATVRYSGASSTCARSTRSTPREACRFRSFGLGAGPRSRDGFRNDAARAAAVDTRATAADTLCSRCKDTRRRGS